MTVTCAFMCMWEPSASPAGSLLNSPAPLKRGARCPLCFCLVVGPLVSLCFLFVSCYFPFVLSRAVWVRRISISIPVSGVKTPFTFPVVLGSNLHSRDRFGGQGSIPVPVSGVKPPFPYQILGLILCSRTRFWYQTLCSVPVSGGQPSIPVPVSGIKLPFRCHVESE